MSTDTLATVDIKPELVRTLHIIYALHALGLVLGAFGAASVIGSFLFGWPSIIAVMRAAPGSSRTSAGRSARSGTR